MVDAVLSTPQQAGGLRAVVLERVGERRFARIIFRINVCAVREKQLDQVQLARGSRFMKRRKAVLTPEIGIRALLEEKLSDVDTSRGRRRVQRADFHFFMQLQIYGGARGEKGGNHVFVTEEGGKTEIS